MKTKNSQEGFTLIELLVVILILGLIMAYALPNYRNYVVRSKAAECFPAMTTAKLEISQFWQARNTLPTANNDAFLPTPSSFATENIATIEVVNGDIICSFNNNDPDLSGGSIQLLPTVESGNLTWTCFASRLDLAHVPGDCN